MVRFGIIVPSSNTTMEEEFRKMASNVATIHAARMRLREATLEDLVEMEKQALQSAISLADANVDVIAYGCTIGSLFRGLGHDKKIVSDIQKTVNVPTVATAGAVVSSLNRLGVRKVCVGTPYTDELNRIEKIFLEANGIHVLRIEGLGIIDNIEIGKQSAHVAYELAKRVHMEESDGIFLSCTNLKTIEIINEVEEEIGKPVVSSNTATLWAMMRKVGATWRTEMYGQLLTLI